MTKYIYFVYKGDKGYHSILTRLSDGLIKYFYQASGSVEGLSFFMDSLTDDLVDGFFPRAGKKTVDCDNWAFLGDNPDRVKAETLAKKAFEEHKLTQVN